ncbi:hypothetical protein M422DRAFT_173713 [Sphaerobolus stellatus SS14]|uniref:Integral membrane protein n=1 Tax=Sphaerobolus stellatus (strain SS14) TaxID=990650 RepID=A0A0C9VR90_SPHS4|nr:hypothetical protein M422DRAFT_173713 [Sphaerobolus stellatus SS14]
MVSNFMLTALATVVTFLRLYDRARSARLWWDDAWAAFTVLLINIFMAAEIRSARISILFTVVRFLVGTLRKILSYVFIVFLTIWAVLFAQVWWVCEPEPGWKDAPLPQCDLGLNVAVVQVITDVLCDAFLIFVPLRPVMEYQISITAIFSTTIVTTCVSMSHTFFVLRAGGLKEALAAIVQVAVSLIVTNLSVLMAYLFRIGTEEPESAPTFGTRSIITFGGSGKKRNPAITTTYITTETMVHEDPGVITLKTLESTVDGEEGQFYMKGHVMTRI